MHSLETIDKINAQAVAKFHRTPATPFAVVHKVGLNVLEVVPVESKAQADEIVARVNTSIGESASII